jgi:hypothetical protein
MWVEPVGVKALEVGVVLMVLMGSLVIRGQGRDDRCRAFAQACALHIVQCTLNLLMTTSQARWRQRFNGLFPMGGCDVASIMDWQILRISSTQT